MILPEFTLRIGLLPGALLCAEAVASAAMVIPLVRLLRRRIASAETPDDTADDTAPEKWPSLAVVAFASCMPDELDEFAASLEAQEYPGSYTVVIVYDASAEAMKEMTETFAQRHPGVHLTFIPPGSHNLSRVKLANTIGIKAAEDAEVILTTTSDSRPQSAQWARPMAAPFINPDIELSLGTTEYPFSGMGLRGWYREFDSLLRTSAWISSARTDLATRGCGENLAFRRSLFFRHKGYAGSIDLHRGEDDIFVADVATADNCAVLESPESRTFTYLAPDPNRRWIKLKAERLFTASYIRRHSSRAASVSSLFAWLTVALGIAAGITGWPNLTVAAAALGILTIGACIIIGFYRSCASAVGARRLWWGVVPYLMWRPIGTAIFRMRMRRFRSRNFTSTWVRPHHGGA